MIRNPAQKVTQVRFGVQPIQSGRLDQTIKDSRPLATLSEPANK
jgi:hypothetical protein